MFLITQHNNFVEFYVEFYSRLSNALNFFVTRLTTASAHNNTIHKYETSPKFRNRVIVQYKCFI